MRIYVCVKHVPDTAAKITITGDMGYDSQVKFVANPFDVCIRKVYPDG